MALTRCYECNNQISDKATSCPNCGCPLTDIYKVDAPDCIKDAPKLLSFFHTRNIVFISIFIILYILAAYIFNKQRLTSFLIIEAMKPNSHDRPGTIKIKKTRYNFMNESYDVYYSVDGGEEPGYKSPTQEEFKLSASIFGSATFPKKKNRIMYVKRFLGFITTIDTSIIK